MNIRHTEIADLPTVMGIYAYAREQMKANGNPHQWGDTNPPEATIITDIQNRNSYVLEQNGTICGVFTFLIGEDPTYRTIDGQWKQNGVYGTIHRIASGGRGNGVFRHCLQFCEAIIPNIRIDTHRDNRIMRHLIEKHGFEKCGIIHLADGSPRIAYQKVLKGGTST
ncbi:MAG: N-acetyltransferase [Oscillospiraceae bacterium]|nr:N-acetyltransferase [Oscillospiraceae bacterium]